MRTYHLPRISSHPAIHIFGYIYLPYLVFNVYSNLLYKRGTSYISLVYKDFHPPTHSPHLTSSYFSSNLRPVLSCEHRSLLILLFTKTDCSMDQVSIKTPNPKCRLYWCLIEFIDWRYSQSCWYFRPLLWTITPLTCSLVHLPLLPPPPSLWRSTGDRTCVHTVCNRGEGWRP